MSYRQSEQELIAHLAEQRDLLRASARVFDDGLTVAAKHLALSVRVLCHDTANSHALLAQLGLLDTIAFVDMRRLGVESDTETDLDPDETRTRWTVMFHSPLAPMGGGPLGYRPRLDGDHEPAKPFAEWWHTVVIQAVDVTLTRRDVVLALANQDGGAHVGATLHDSNYVAVSRQGALGTITFKDSEGVARTVDANPTLVVMRTIGHEVLETLTPIIGA